MKKSKKIIGLILFSSIFTSVAVSAAVGYFTSQDKVTNKFEAGTPNGSIIEEFNPGDSWSGEEITKKVTIKNEENIEVLLRVSLQPRWVEVYLDEEGQEKERPWSGDNDIVKLNTINIITSIKDEDTGEIFSEKWIKGNDGYYYYTSKLGQGKTTSKILETVEIDETKFNSLINKDAYYGKKLLVDVRSEVVQAAHGAWENTWTITDNNIKALLGTIEIK